MIKKDKTSLLAAVTTPVEPSEDGWIRHSTVRILREALSNMHRRGNPPVKKFIFQTLKDYQAAIAPYCKHVEMQTGLDGYPTCIDCGHREEIECPDLDSKKE